MFMVKKLLALILLLATTTIYAQTRPGSLRGTVADAKNGETIPFANIVIKDAGGQIMAGGSTDFDGGYNINPVPPEEYTVEATVTGYAKYSITGMSISPNAPTIQDFKLQEESAQLQEVVITY